MPTTNFHAIHQLPSLDVNRQLIETIEDYALVRLPSLLQIEPDFFRSRWSITIEDADGREKVNTIRDYRSDELPSTVRSVSCAATITTQELHFAVNIRFHHKKLLADFDISAQTEHSKELVSSIVSGMMPIIKTRSSLNWLFHVDAIQILLISASAPLAGWGIGGLIIYGGIGYRLMLGVALISVFLAGYCPRLFPYMEFDTPSQRRRNTFRNWMFWGLLSFLVFGTALSMVRRDLFGF